MATHPRSSAAHAVVRSLRLGALLLLVAAGALRSQERTGRLTGVVHDDGGRPIENVEVTAIDQSKMVRTDSAGRFVFPALTPGTIALSLRRLAFEPAVVRTDVGEDDTLRVDVTLSVVAQRLSAVLVAERVEKGRTLVGFEMRRRQGVGHFVTRAQIEQRHPNLLSDMMRMVPGVVLLPGENGRQTLRFAGVSRASCPPMYYLDGILAVGFTIDEIPPGDVEGVELYGGAAGVPPEYSRSRGTSNCGTVLIWSRIPGF